MLSAVSKELVAIRSLVFTACSCSELRDTSGCSSSTLTIEWGVIRGGSLCTRGGRGREVLLGGDKATLTDLSANIWEDILSENYVKVART